MTRVEEELLRTGNTAPERAISLRARALCAPGPTAREEFEARVDGALSSRRAAHRVSATIRSSLPEGHAYLRRDGSAGEARHVAPRRLPSRNSETSGVVACCRANGPMKRQSRLRRLCALALLPRNARIAISIPMCAKRDDETRWAARIARELKLRPHVRPAATVFDLFRRRHAVADEPLRSARCSNAIRRLWRVAPDVEITLEANPTSVEATRFRDYRAAGVNRVSIGVQALDDASLKALGRLHPRVKRSMRSRSRAPIFARDSFDLIYARPDQTRAMGRGIETRDLGRRPNICRSTSSPSKRARLLRRCTPRGKLKITR